ncbi:MAG: hypothetical protein PHY47_15595 [Lachnospiraceae bacterium]|nr:hypothetical protein [Lachnospiraceae bacterium]
MVVTASDFTEDDMSILKAVIPEERMSHICVTRDSEEVDFADIILSSSETELNNVKKIRWMMEYGKE